MIHVLNKLIDGFEEEKKSLSAHFKPASYKKGAIVLHCGDVWNRFVFIESGLFRLFYTTEGGKEFNKGFFSDSELMGPIAPIARNTPSRFTIQALEPCRVRACHAENLRKEFTGTLFGETFFRRLAEWLANEKVMREAEFLLDDAETRYSTFVERFPELERRMANRHIASYLGITDVSLSRIRKRRTLRS